MLVLKLIANIDIKVYNFSLNYYKRLELFN